jgi:hypothetical protein
MRNRIGVVLCATWTLWCLVHFPWESASEQNQTISVFANNGCQSCAEDLAERVSWHRTEGRMNWARGIFRPWVVVTLLWCGLTGLVSYANFNPQTASAEHLPDAYLIAVLKARADVAQPRGRQKEVISAIIAYIWPWLSYFLAPPAALVAFGYAASKRDQPTKT